MKKQGVYSGHDLRRLGMPSMQQVEDLVNEIRRCLSGKPPMLQSAALADIVSMYFAGCHPEVRAEIMDAWLTTMRGLIKGNEAALLEKYGMSGWDDKTNDPSSG